MSLSKSPVFILPDGRRSTCDPVIVAIAATIIADHHGEVPKNFFALLRAKVPDMRGQGISGYIRAAKSQLGIPVTPLRKRRNIADIGGLQDVAPALAHYQSLLDEEHQLDARLRTIKIELQKYKPITNIVTDLRDAVRRLKDRP